MAFGNAESQRWKGYIRAEENASFQWKDKWGWILEEYRILKKDMDFMSEKYKAAQPKIGKIYPPDPRTTKPLPKSTAHQIGWLAARLEFKLEKYGPDKTQIMPFKSLHP